MELHEDCEAVRRERIVDAPRDQVWAALADPAELAGWLADELDVPAVEPGAEGVARDGGETRLVRVEEVDPLRRLALRWWPATGVEADGTLVELTLEDEANARTRVVAVELPLRTLHAVSEAVVAGGRASGPELSAAGGLAAAGWR